MHYSIFQSPNIEDTRIITLSVNTYKCCVVYEVFEVKHFLDISKCLFRFLYICTWRVVLNMHMHVYVHVVILHTINKIIFVHMFTYKESLSVVVFLTSLVRVCDIGGPFLSGMTDLSWTKHRLTNEEMGSSLLEKRKGLLRSKYVCYIKNKSVTVVKVTALLYTHPVAFPYF